jgi:hypothetical protein
MTPHLAQLLEHEDRRHGCVPYHTRRSARVYRAKLLRGAAPPPTSSALIKHAAPPSRKQLVHSSGTPW